MTATNIAQSALLVLLVTAAGLAAEPAVAPMQKPASFLGRLWGRAKPSSDRAALEPPATLPLGGSASAARPIAAEPSAAETARVAPAAWNEPAGANAAAVERPRSRWTSWLLGKRGLTRTVSEFMAYERP
jgi:hypothetical protein